MNLSAPTKPVFIVSVVLAILGLLPMLGVALPFIGAYACWVLLAGFVLLALGCVLKGF